MQGIPGASGTYVYAYSEFAGTLNHSLHYFSCETSLLHILPYVTSSSYRTRIILGRHSAGKAEKRPLFQTLIMQIGFTSKEINSLPQLWGPKLQNNLYFENFENLPKEKIT